MFRRFLGPLFETPGDGSGGGPDLSVVAGSPIPAAGEGTPSPEPEMEEIRGKHGYKRTADGNIIVGDNNRKYVREEALREERKARQQAQQLVDSFQPFMGEFTEYLTSKRQKQQETQQRAQDQPQSQFTPDELDGFAMASGYYDGNNNPDRTRAEAALKVLTRVQARQLQPFVQSTLNERGNQNVSRALNYRFVDGEPLADPKYINSAFNALPPEYRSDPEIAQATALIAVGLEELERRRDGKPSRGRRAEPAFRESTSGRYGEDGTNRLSDFDMAAARSRGVAPDKWAASMRALSRSDATGGVILDDID